MTKICAHSGCEKTLDGSEENITTAIRAGVDIIELDLRQCNNGIYLAHDDIKNEQGLVSLERCLDILNGSDIYLNCDLKEADIVQNIIDCLKKNNYFNKAIFTGDVHGALDVLNKNNAMYYYSIDEYDEGYKAIKQKEFPKILELYKELSAYRGFQGFNLCYEEMDDDYEEFFTKHNIPLCLWTIDEHKMIDKFLNVVDCITTNEILYALSKRAEC